MGAGSCRCQVAIPPHARDQNSAVQEIQAAFKISLRSGVFRYSFAVYHGDDVFLAGVQTCALIRIGVILLDDPLYVRLRVSLSAKLQSYRRN